MIIAGTGFEVCAQLPALTCAAEGYDPYVAVDACGLFAPVPSVAAISRLTQAGVALMDARVIVLEAMAGNAHPQGSEIYATLGAGLVPHSVMITVNGEGQAEVESRKLLVHFLRDGQALAQFAVPPARPSMPASNRILEGDDDNGYDRSA